MEKLRGLAEAIRIATVPPLMALVLLLALHGAGYFPGASLGVAIFCLTALPILTYPIWFLVPALRRGMLGSKRADCGGVRADVPALAPGWRASQRKLAIVFSVVGYVAGAVYCLLAHDLRHPDPVGVARAPPGEIARGARVPGRERRRAETQPFAFRHRPTPSVLDRMTSNIGAREISQTSTMGFSSQGSAGLSDKEITSRVNAELKKVFRPEFLNRVDEVVVFKSLTPEQLHGIVDLMLRRAALLNGDADWTSITTSSIPSSGGLPWSFSIATPSASYVVGHGSISGTDEEKTAQLMAHFLPWVTARITNG